MLSDAIRSRLFSSFVLCSLVLCLIASLSYAQDCPSCDAFLNRPQAKVLVAADQDTHVAQINVYYDDSTATPSRQPVNDSIVLVELTNSSGLKYLYKTYTDSSGSATFDFTQWDKACVNIKILYCPFCNVAGGDCGFAQCINYSNIHNETGYYKDIDYAGIPGGAITSPDGIPSWGSAPAPSPLNSQLYFPDLTTMAYCAPPGPQSETPAFCLPLVIIFALLSGALYMTGRNPFASFNLSGSRVGKHIRYQARGRGFSMNVSSVATAVSSGIKAAEGPKGADGKAAKNADGTTKTRWQAMKEEARATGGPLKAFGSVLVQGSRSQQAWAAHKEASAASKGKGAGAYAAELKSRLNPQQSVSAGAAQTSGAPRLQAGQILTGGSGRSPDVGAVIGKFGLGLGTLLLFASGSAIGRIADSYATIGGGKPLLDRMMDDKGVAALRLRENLQAADNIKKAGGVVTGLPNGDTGILVGKKETIDPKTGIVTVTAVYKVLPEVGSSVQGDLTPKTVTLTMVKEQDPKGGGMPALTSTSSVTIRIVSSPEKVDSSGKVIKEAESKEFPVLAKMENGKAVFFIKTEVAGKPVDVPVKVETNNTLSVSGRRVDVVQGAFDMSDTSKVRDFGIQGNKMVVGEPVVKIASVETSFALAGTKEPITVKTVPGGETTVVFPKGVSMDQSEIKAVAAQISTKTLGISNLTDKGDASSMLNAQKASMDYATQLGQSITTNVGVIQRDKTEEWNQSEKKSWGELARDPVALASVKKAEQEIAGDALASVGIIFNPAEVKNLSPAETKGRAFAGSNSEALFDIKKAVESSAFVDPKKSLGIGEGIAAKAGTPLQGDVLAAAMDMMVNPKQHAEGVGPARSVDDLKKIDPETAKLYIQAAVREAQSNGSISPAEASKLSSPAVAKELSITVQVEAKSVGDILGMLPKSNAAQVPVADLNAIRNTDISTTAACEHAGVPVPPSLAKVNSERETLYTTNKASEQMGMLASDGKFDQRIMDRLDVISRGSENYLGSGVGVMAPKIPKDASTSLNSADAQRSQLARADAAMLESAVYIDPNTGKQQIREGALADAFAQKLDDNAERYRAALDPKNPDYTAAAKIAHETEGMCRDVGDNKAASTWNYLGEAPSVAASEQIAWRSNPTADERKSAERAADAEREKVLRAAVPVGPPTLEQQYIADLAANAKKEDMLAANIGEKSKGIYGTYIYAKDLDPDKGVIPAGGEVARSAQHRVDDMNSKVAQMEERAATIMEDAAKKSAGPPERKLGKKADES